MGITNRGESGARLQLAVFLLLPRIGRYGIARQLKGDLLAAETLSVEGTRIGKRG